MKINLKYAAIVVLWLITGNVEPIFAQIPVRKGPASAGEIKTARSALEVNMNSVEAHQTYIYAMGLSNPLLLEQYKAWMKKYPGNVTIPLAIGTVYYNAEMPQAKEFLLKAAAMQPQNARIWSMLSDDAFYRGQNALSIDYARKAALAEPSNAAYAYAYIHFFKDSDPEMYKQKIFDFVKRFPGDERGAQALYWLAQESKDLSNKIEYFELLRKLYLPQKFNWASAGMERLADTYLQTSPEKALALVKEMGDAKEWQIRKQVAESLIRVNKLEQDQNYKDAIISLDQIKLPKYNGISDFIIFKKSALYAEAGNGKAAYDNLAVNFAKLPTDQLYSALVKYGQGLGKDSVQIEKDIETIRNNTAVPAYPFELGLYTSEGKLSLSDLKGKVVLLTFWFPACAPCRAEFPHFQAVINEFKGKDVVYLGINVTPGQDPYVVPFLKNTKFSFIPLRGNTAFAEKNYGVQGEPENFLIDKNGKIIFSSFLIDETNHRTLELMISSLLQKSRQPD